MILQVCRLDEELWRWLETAVNSRIVKDVESAGAGGTADAARRPWKTPVVILSKLADSNKPTPFPTENIGSLPPTATGPS